MIISNLLAVFWSAITTANMINGDDKMSVSVRPPQVRSLYRRPPPLPRRSAINTHASLTSVWTAITARQKYVKNLHFNAAHTYLLVNELCALEQCFPTGVPWNLRVPWAWAKGSVRNLGKYKLINNILIWT
jgi:hypothetical protein